MCSFCARDAACRLSRLFRLGETLRQGVMALRLVSTVGGTTDIGATISHTVQNKRSGPLVQKTTPASNESSTTRRKWCVVFRRGRTRNVGQRRRGSCRPTPWRLSSGTSISAHSASQMSRGGVPSARASRAVRPPTALRPRSLTREEALSPNSVSTARRNSLRRITTPFGGQCSES